MYSLDVLILYKIVDTAQRSSIVDDLPFRAIFAAYDQVLSQHGISSDHDQVYLRFLFRLGERREPGETLQERFEKLLAELDIKIEFGSDESSEADITRTEGYTDDGRVADETVEDELGLRRRRERRASFSEVYDAEDESTKAERARAESSASVSRLQDHSGGFGARMPSKSSTARQKERARSVHQENPALLPRSRRMSTEGFAENLKSYQNSGSSRLRNDHREPLHSQGTVNGMSRALKANRNRPQQDIVIYEDSIEDGTTASASSFHLEGAQHDDPVPHEFIFRPSHTQMLRDADTFNHFHVRATSRSLLNKWRNVFIKAQRNRDDMERQAVNQFRRVLLRQAYDQWRYVYLSKKQALETERFFARLEKRAVRARDLYLLTKAFTHWAECAAEELERSSVARRHIVRLRYSNAWKDITAVNELKVRRQGLRKFFGIWSQRLRTSWAQSQKAVVIYQENLVETTYWRWFWSFCERRAPEWRHGTLKRQTFAKWALASQRHIERGIQVSTIRDDNSKKRCLSKWIERYQLSRSQQDQADQFKERQMTSRALPLWRLQLKHAPLARRVTGMVNWRIASSAFSTMVKRFALEKQAEAFNKRRIVRNAWKQWNIHLRCQALQHQIDDRLMVQVLYKWVLAERCVLLQRLSREKVKENVFGIFVDKWRETLQRNEASFNAVIQSRNRNLLASTLRKWRQKLRLQEDRERSAQEFLSPRVVRESLQIWITKHNHQSQLNFKAEKASFWFRGKRSLRSLRTAVSISQKQRRRDAYAQIRRTIKMNLARRLLLCWHDRASTVESQTRIADQQYQEHLTTLALNLLTQWRTATSNFLSLKDSATAQFHSKILTQAFTTWSSRNQQVLTNTIAAYTFVSPYVERTAYDCLHRLQLRVLEHQSLSSKAESFYAWNMRRRIPVLFRGWKERASRRRSGDEDEREGQSPINLLRMTRTPRTRRVDVMQMVEENDNLESLQLQPQLVDDRLDQDADDLPQAQFSPNTRYGSPPFDPPWIPPAHNQSSPSPSLQQQPPPILLQSTTTPLTTPFAPLSYLNTPSRRAARARAKAAPNATALTSPPQQQPQTQVPVSPQRHPLSYTPLTIPNIGKATISRLPNTNHVPLQAQTGDVADEKLNSLQVMGSKSERTRLGVNGAAVIAPGLGLGRSMVAFGGGGGGGGKEVGIRRSLFKRDDAWRRGEGFGGDGAGDEEYETEEGEEEQSGEAEAEEEGS